MSALHLVSTPIPTGLISLQDWQQTPAGIRWAFIPQGRRRGFDTTAFLRPSAVGHLRQRSIAGGQRGPAPAILLQRGGMW